MSGSGAPSRQDALLFSPQRQVLWAGLARVRHRGRPLCCGVFTALRNNLHLKHMTVLYHSWATADNMVRWNVYAHEQTNAHVCGTGQPATVICSESTGLRRARCWIWQRQIEVACERARMRASCLRVPLGVEYLISVKPYNTCICSNNMTTPWMSIPYAQTRLNVWGRVKWLGSDVNYETPCTNISRLCLVCFPGKRWLVGSNWFKHIVTGWPIKQLNVRLQYDQMK